MAAKTRDWYYAEMKVVGKQVDASVLDNGTPEFLKNFMENKTDEGTLLENNYAFEENDSDDDEKELLVKQQLEDQEKKEIKRYLPGPGKPINVQIFFGIYLEKDICTQFKFDKLKMLTVAKNYSILKDYTLLKIHTKHDSVRVGAFKPWRASLGWKTGKQFAFFFFFL